MPTTYAHQYFGSRVRAQLGTEFGSLIQRHANLFDLGLQGPDLLFYHRPFRKDPVNRKGHEIHNRPALQFLESAVPAARHSADPESAAVYLMGFLCHFLLDSECHPIVNRVTETAGVHHNTVEKELDRTLMQIDGLDPLSHRPGDHLLLEQGEEELIASFYKGVTAGQIRESFRSMKRVLAAIVTPSRYRYQMTLLLIRSLGKEQSFGSLLMARQPVPACRDSSRELVKTLDRMILPAAAYVEEFYRVLMGESLQMHETLKKRLEADFG